MVVPAMSCLIAMPCQQADVDGRKLVGRRGAILDLGQADGGACNSLKSLRSSAQDTASPISTPQNGAPIERIGTFATVTRKQTVAPSVKPPLNETTKARSSTRSSASPASVAMNALGVASMSRVTTGAKIPNSSAKSATSTPAA